MKTLTVKQVAKLRSVHPQTVRDWVRHGKIPDRRSPGSRKMIFLRSDVIVETDKAA